MKVFISYAAEDDRKRKNLAGALLKANPVLTPVVVSDRREPGKPLADKVIDCIQESDFLVPILTRSSISNQWVNQEIGYARGIESRIVPIVERSVIPKLKGFIHDQHDLPFGFDGSPLSAAKEARAFRQAYLLLIDYLESLSGGVSLSSTVEPSRVRAGENYTTRVRFRGTVLNGFFDNLVVHVGSDFKTWNWDRESIPPELGRTTPSNAAPGVLNGQVDVSSAYTWPTAGWPQGKYRIFVRLYSHLVPGVPGRTVVAENQHDFEVL